MGEEYAVEEWRPITGFALYEISSKGRVRSWKTRGDGFKRATRPVILTPTKDKDGYNKVILCANKVRSTKRVATLVCEAWHGPRPEGKLVCHADGSKTNDTPENLRWGTAKENSADAALHGTSSRGSRVNTSELSEQDVRAIRKSAEEAATLADAYGVTIGTIYHIKRGHTWKWMQ